MKRDIVYILGEPVSAGSPLVVTEYLSGPEFVIKHRPEGWYTSPRGWDIFRNKEVKRMLIHLASLNVLIELKGVVHEDKYYCTDLMLNGQTLDYEPFYTTLEQYQVRIAPEIIINFPLTQDNAYSIELEVNGLSYLSNKMREGIVIRPMIEGNHSFRKVITYARAEKTI